MLLVRKKRWICGEALHCFGQPHVPQREAFMARESWGIGLADVHDAQSMI